MKIEYKIVEAILDILSQAESNEDDSPDDEFLQGYLEGLHAAYNKASKIADGFE